MAFIKRADVRFRFDKFGGLCWLPRGNIYSLNKDEAVFFALCNKPRDFTESQFLINNDIDLLISKFMNAGLIVHSSTMPVPINKKDYLAIQQKAKIASNKLINKPFWVHIQPFTYCNLNCLYCYCNGGTSGTDFMLPLHAWKRIVDKLVAFGVLDIYVTGGENLINKDCLLLTEYILCKGLGTGMSTNATAISKDVLLKLSKLNLKYIQVSIDSPYSWKNDYLKGKEGSLNKTIDGVRELKHFIEPIINTVVNKINKDDSESLIQFGLSLGINKFKIFPLKASGKAMKFPDLLLSNKEILDLTAECQRLEKKYTVKIEYPIVGTRCGSGHSGFAIDCKGDIYPCIFGICDKKQRMGNVLQDNLNQIWFKSEKFNNFRALNNLLPCTRCEIG